MNSETIENILNFLETKDGKEKPEKWYQTKNQLDLVMTFKNRPDDTQYTHYGDLFFNIPRLVKSSITKLPKDLYVTRSFFLNNIQQPLELPDKLYVGKDFYMYRSNVSELPKYLYVVGDFNIKSTPLAEKYTDEEIRKIVASTDGQIRGKIIR